MTLQINYPLSQNSQKPNFIAIDETLANSKLQWLIWLSVATGLGLLIFGLNLPFSYQMGLVILLVICVFFAQLLPYHLVAISTLPLPYASKKDGLGEVEWQLGITQLDVANFFTPNQQVSQQQTQLWQARLLEANLYPWVIVCKFWVDEPMERKLMVSIWQDQVTPETWRQLCVLAKL